MQGNLYTPRTGVGACTTGAVDALSETGSAQIRGSIIQLPAPVNYPAPPLPSPLPPTTNVSITSSTGACAALKSFRYSAVIAVWACAPGRRAASARRSPNLPYSEQEHGAARVHGADPGRF